MITAAEIRKKTERKYADYLRSVVAGTDGHPFAIERGERLWLHD